MKKVKKKRSLTRRQSEVLKFVLDQLEARRVSPTVDEIAEHFSLDRTTIKQHLKHIYDKLDVHNRQQLTIHAIQSGIVSTYES